jgi:hypothetical protein
MPFGYVHWAHCDSLWRAVYDVSTFSYQLAIPFAINCIHLHTALNRFNYATIYSISLANPSPRSCVYNAIQIILVERSTDVDFEMTL